MKVLFVASNPADAATLNLEREITELQRRFAEAAGEPVTFIFLPNLRVEELPAALSRHRPDILHISAHGANEQLSLTNEAKVAVKLDASTLIAFLAHERPPRLIYLNACDSLPIADELAAVVPMTIGISAPITNRAARASAVAFYERILDGARVAEAFSVAKKMVEVMDHQTASASLFARGGANPALEVLHRTPRLVAGLCGELKAGQKRFNVRFGLIGCPSNTAQVIFFTDDESYVNDEESYEEDLCLVVRGYPVRGIIWADAQDKWETYGDFRIFAVGVTGDGLTFSICSMLCDAIELRYRLNGASAIPPAVAAAVAQLRTEDGTEIDAVLSLAVTENVDLEGGKVTKARKRGK